MSSDEVQNNKLQILGKLSASLLHEIRNPLSAIKLNLDYLKMIQNELPAEAVESVAGCAEAVQRIQHLIDMLLDFSRKGSNKTSDCSLNDVTLRAIEIVHGNSSRLNINLNHTLYSGSLKLRINKSNLLQVMINLITNAIEACENKGNVMVRTYLNKDRRIIWEVEDDGVGINEEDKEKIFKDFFTKKTAGTGLGLSVCRMILAEFNSELDFESKEGDGTRFFIKFNSGLVID